MSQPTLSDAELDTVFNALNGGGTPKFPAELCNANPEILKVKLTTGEELCEKGSVPKLGRIWKLVEPLSGNLLTNDE